MKIDFKLFISLKIYINCNRDDYLCYTLNG